MEKRTVILNGVEFTTTAEEQITGSLIKDLWEAAAEDQVWVKPTNGEPYRLTDEAVLPPDTDQVVIIPAFGGE
jgi:hypothetical protein